MTTLEELSDQYIKDVFTDYRNAMPFEESQFVKMYDDDGKLFAIGEVLRLWWDDKFWDWTMECLIVEDSHRWTEYISAGNCVRHVGFMARIV